jgi:hypothetical protein
MELTTETGATSENLSDQKEKNLLGRVMLILSAEQLAEAITRAHGVKMSPDDFALKSAVLILKILPPLYYEPRSS